MERMDAYHREAGLSRPSHRLSNSYIAHSPFPKNENSPCSPVGNKDRKLSFCGTTLFAG